MFRRSRSPLLESEVFAVFGGTNNAHNECLTELTDGIIIGESEHMFIVSTAQYTFINYLPRTRLGEKLPDRLIPSFSIECQKSFPCTKFDLCKYLAQDYFIAVKMKLKIFPYNQLCISMH